MAIEVKTVHFGPHLRKAKKKGQIVNKQLLEVNFLLIEKKKKMWINFLMHFGFTIRGS